MRVATERMDVEICVWKRSITQNLVALLFLSVCPGSPTVCFVEWRLKDSTSKSVSGGVVLLAAVSTRPGSAKVQGVARHLHNCRCESVSGGGETLDGFFE